MILGDYIRETISGKTLYRILFQQEVFKASRYIKGRVLDIGSGEGPTYKKYLPKDISYITTDYVQKTGISQIVNFNEKFPFDDSSIDSVFLFHNLYIAENPNHVLGEVRRVLKEGGYLLISNPFGVNVMPEPHDYGRLTGEGLEKILKDSNLKIESIVKIGDRFSVGAYALHAFFLIWPIRFIFNSLALLLDKLVPSGMKKKQPFPLGYFIVAKK